MANKREFKKSVDALGESVFGTLMLSFEQAKDENKEKIGEIITKVLTATENARKQADITFDKGVKAFGSLKEYSVAKKKFYKDLFDKIKNDFSKEIGDSLKELNAVLPKEVKEENKKAVNPA